MGFWRFCVIFVGFLEPTLGSTSLTATLWFDSTCSTTSRAMCREQVVAEVLEREGCLVCLRFLGGFWLLMILFSVFFGIVGWCLLIFGLTESPF